jgi:leucyl-tRNA synthetase
MADIYPFQEVEHRWQAAWRDANVQYATEIPSQKKYYVLEMLPYPSGRLHMGHVRNYSIGDAIARYKKMAGFNILHPIGWDAFGLPAENAAIKHKIHPATWTLDNIAFMKAQMQRLGFHYDWTKEVTTCLPEYYRWNQWFFLKMFERGLVYKKYGAVNWCNVCQTVLANEQVVNGGCWRDGSPIVQKKLEQWFIRITAYADELLAEIDGLTDWPERVKIMQRNWIGRSQGANVFFPVEGIEERIEIFTTRIDTIYGANAIILSPEHPMIDRLLEGHSEQGTLREAIHEIIRKVKADRSFADTSKDGLSLGRFAINPFNGERLPIWIGNFVLMEYGTGAIMAVPGHDGRDREFSLKYDLPIRPVILAPDGNPPEGELYEGYGMLIHSGPYNGLTSEEAMDRMARHAEENGFGKAAVTFRMRDWGVSRQRYWGTPIPIIYCDRCGMMPVPDEQLPVLLPPMETIDYHGGSPLLNIPDFVDTTCPRCGGPGRRDTDTMDTFIDSSWYFLRYTDPKNSELPVDLGKIAYWFPVDIYIGGIEHAVGHLIFMRFWWKMMRDLGLVSGREPVTRLLTQGMVIKDGAKMSKSLGNTVDPDYLIEKYGADTSRLFILFASPPEKDLDWSDQGIEGCFRFLNRVWRMVDKHAAWLEAASTDTIPAEPAPAALRLLQKAHFTIQKVTRDIEEKLQFNTAIAACMELTNEIYAADNAGLRDEADRTVFKFSLETLVLLLSPFAPHLAEELWSMLGHADLVVTCAWPEADSRYLAAETVEIPVMVNGKLRTRLEVPMEAGEEEVRSIVLDLPKVQELLGQKQLKKYFYVKHKIVNLVIQ